MKKKIVINTAHHQVNTPSTSPTFSFKTSPTSSLQKLPSAAMFFRLPT